jgi:hypothetical protein
MLKRTEKQCVVCSSSIYELWLPFWYLQTLLLIRFVFSSHLNKNKPMTCEVVNTGPGLRQAHTCSFKAIKLLKRNMLLLRCMRKSITLLYLKKCTSDIKYDCPCQGRIQGAGPLKLKNMIFWRKIVIFHTKYPKYFRAFLRSVQFV